MANLGALLTAIAAMPEPEYQSTLDKKLDRQPFFHRQEITSAAYKASRIEGETFMITRMPAHGTPEIPLGRVTGVDRAEKRLDWWIANDMRVVRILKIEQQQVMYGALCLKRGFCLVDERPAPCEQILDLMIEAAHKC